MDQKQFEAMVKGTVLEEIMTVNLADVVAPDDKVENEDAILGVMNDLEKRFFLLADQKRNAFNDQNKKRIEAVCDECHLDQLKELRDQLQQISEMMWNLIQLRFGLMNMAIREGFQIESLKRSGRVEEFLYAISGFKSDRSRLF